MPPDLPEEISEKLRLPVQIEHPGPFVIAAVNITLSGVAFKTKFPLPQGVASYRHLLPVLRSFGDAIIHAGVEQAEAAKTPPTCRTGCAACCRQLVPVTYAEAHALTMLVNNLPEPRRSEMRGRFEMVKQKLAAAGLLERVRAQHGPTEEEAYHLGLAYVQARIACPFLENEMCSIYHERPLICREYHVTTDPVLCENPSPEIRLMALPAEASTALSRSYSPVANPKPVRQTIPLPLLLEWSEANPEVAPTQTGAELFQNFLRHLVVTQLPRV